MALLPKFQWGDKSMKINMLLRKTALCSALATTLAMLSPTIAPMAASAQNAGADALSKDLVLSVGRGRLINLPRGISDVFVANEVVADVQVRSATQLYIYGRAAGETSVYATDAAGKVVFSTIVRVGNNMETIDEMLMLAMPDASVRINTMNGFVLLTGTVAQPEDAAEAERLVEAFVGDKIKVISRLQTATPLQVNLQVRIAEVNKSLVKEIGANLATNETTDGFLFGALSGRPGAIVKDSVTGRPNTFIGKEGTTTLAIAKKLFGLDIGATFDLAERSGLVVTLSQPNLTALSGETADFLAGGEFPVPTYSRNEGVTIQYKKYGVSLAYTPTVLSNGRISLRVRPEVSELSTEGSVRIEGFEIPALTVRRAETSVELGSGESFMIAGLMQNRSIGSITKAPGLGDIPILGNLFKSDAYRRGETELVIIVTPYLVKPVNANDIKLPTDAFRTSTDAQRILINQTTDGISGGSRPVPSMVPTQSDAMPQVGSAPMVPADQKQAKKADDKRAEGKSRKDKKMAEATPGFGF
jgi:pilus assembly protein CpaC